MPDDSTEYLTQPIATERPPGMINSVCSFSDHNGRRYIQIRGINCYAYDLADRVGSAMTRSR